jgi:geranylgeranyl reductase family protein
VPPLNKSYDVIVVGAGPGGSASAYYLARGGFKVLLLDKAAFPRDKTCGDALTPRAIRELQNIGISALELPKAWRVGVADVVAPNGKRVSVPLPKRSDWPDFMAIVPRLVLDDVIRQRALGAGAGFESPVHVDSIQPSRSGVRLGGRRGKHSFTLQAQAVVLATGANTNLLIQSGVLHHQPRIALAARAYFEDIQGLGAPDHLQFRFDGLPLPGYGWIFPLSESSANIGLGLAPISTLRQKLHPPQKPRQALVPFLKTPGLQASLGRARRLGPIQSFPIRMDFPHAPTYGERLLLVGEAAGLVNPLSGDGIDFALESGRLAASQLAQAFAGNDLSKQALVGYDALLREHFQSLFTFCKAIQKLLAWPYLLNWLVATAARYPRLPRALIEVVLGPEGPAYLKRKLLGRATISFPR